MPSFWNGTERTKLKSAHNGQGVKKNIAQVYLDYAQAFEGDAICKIEGSFDDNVAATLTDWSNNYGDGLD